MTDRELLAFAAKAAGIDSLFDPNGMLRNVTGMHPLQDIFSAKLWNPLTDDGDALRLAVKLKLDLITNTERNQSYAGTKNRSATSYVYHDQEKDSFAATRIAIVRAAAEIGKNM